MYRSGFARASRTLLNSLARAFGSELLIVRGFLRPVNVRGVAKRTLATLRREPLSIHGDLSPEAALAVINERLSGRWFPWGSSAYRDILGYAGAESIAVWAKRRNLDSSGTQVFKGRLIGDDTGCVLVGSMRSRAFGRAYFCLLIGLSGFAAAYTWGFVVWHAFGGGLTLSMIGFALATTAFPLAFFCLYAGAVAISASDAVYLREWFLDCLRAEAPDGRAPQHGSR